MTIRIATLCEACKHFEVRTKTCKAYPRGIPSEIHPWGIWDHREELPNDGGVGFEPDNDAVWVAFVTEWFDADKAERTGQSGMPEQ